MSKKNWIIGKEGWPIDPTANKDCLICRGSGILCTYPPPSGMFEVQAECYGCISDRDEESIRATSYLQNKK